MLLSQEISPSLAKIYTFISLFWKFDFGSLETKINGHSLEKIFICWNLLSQNNQLKMSALYYLKCVVQLTTNPLLIWKLLVTPAKVDNTRVWCRYCQGMGMVVSTLLLILEEGEVFWLLSCIIEDHLPSHYYNTNLFGIQVFRIFFVTLRVFNCLNSKFLGEAMR